MDVRVGTFNLNNLFSRFNFSAQIDAPAPAADGDEVTATYHFSDPTRFRTRTYKGRLVQGKPDADRRRVAQRLLLAGLGDVAPVDVWCVQEVEDIDTLRFFASRELGGRYPHVVLIEGNDPRLIDLAVLSRLPLGAVISWQHRVHPDAPGERVFSRDLLEVEVFDERRRRRLFTVFNNHLKSHFGDDAPGGREHNDTRRAQQAEIVADIVGARTRPDSSYLICGDLNDPPGAKSLAPLTESDLELVDALADAKETAPPPLPAGAAAPPSPAWTYRFKASGVPATYERLDQLWLSPALASRQRDAWIGRRTKLTRDGSDHDPAWITLDV